MSWGGRFRMTIGVLVVLAIVGVATYQLNERRGRAVSTSAQVMAQDIVVGAPYGGVVLERSVDVGAQVTSGEPVFVLDAPAVALAGATGPGAIPDAADVDGQGHLVVQAGGDGTVTSVDAEPGSFVQAGQELAHVQRADSLFVEATFSLTPEQYARVGDHAPVRILLPDGSALDGTADDLRVSTVDGQAGVVATVSSPGLAGGGDDHLMTPGAPVVAELQLRNDGWVTRVGDQVRTAVAGWVDVADARVRDLLARA